MSKDKNRTLLVVEDDANDQALIKRAFQSNEVPSPIHILDNGDEAIAYLSGDGPYADRKTYPFPRLITIDLKMPRGNGFDVLQHIKNHPEWSVIPIIILSSSEDRHDIQTAYALGASAYLCKSSNFPDLRRKLRLFYDFWLECEVPQIDAQGRKLPTESKGKMGENYPT